MKGIFLFILLGLLFTAGCAGTKHLNSSNNSTQIIENGTSYNAVVITEKTESRGVSAEYSWLSKNYPGYSAKEQILSHHKGKPYDIISIVTQSGEELTVYFNISNFFGKF